MQPNNNGAAGKTNDHDDWCITPQGDHTDDTGNFAAVTFDGSIMQQYGNRSVKTPVAKRRQQILLLSEGLMVPAKAALVTLFTVSSTTHARITVPFLRARSKLSTTLGNGGFGPDERLWILVVSLHITLKLRFQFSDAAMDAPPQLAFREGREPALEERAPKPASTDCRKGCRRPKSCGQRFADRWGRCRKPSANIFIRRNPRRA